MLRQRFGTAGKRLIVEECLQGEEASILIFTDGKTAIPLVASQDHKRVFDRDCGPNTGGMGAYSPALLINEGLLRTIMRKIFLPLIQGLNREGKTYKGVLYAGLMIKDNQPYVLEFNVRFGDPETQAILPKLKTDLAEVMLKTINGTLQDIKLSWDERFCVCVVLASGGYPGAYEKNKAISGLDEVAKMKDIIVFHAGTKRATETGKCLPLFLTNGGRVLGITALGKDIKEATQKAYAAVAKIKFEGMHYRKDIGNKALQFLR
jgi:phosphoribosylamine--glycine ligase